MTRGEALLAAGRILRAAGIEGPQRDARRLLERIAGHEAPDARAEAAFFEAVRRRAEGCPVSRIVGRRAFWKAEFEVTEDVLDPRPETETLVEVALASPARRVLDLGTGTGCILLSLLGEWSGAQGVGTDISPAALEVARRNAVRLGVERRAALVRADWFEGVSGRFDLIVSNPPYIAASEIASLSREVREHDPMLALSPGGDGLGAYRAIAGGAGAHLAPGGRVLLEVGAGQSAAVAALLRDAGLDVVADHADLDGMARVVEARTPR